MGSYGRRELQLHSDIDLLLLHTPNINEKSLLHAQAFIQACWDIGLEISHQITTVGACAELASQNLSVISSIMDMHLLGGKKSLMDELRYQTHPVNMWPSNQFFAEKLKEQQQRYNKYGETAYNLEPNIKQGPGGLRDIQILLSISKRHFFIKKLADGIPYNFITDKEYEELINYEHFLWQIRFALHLIAEKNEDRLLFDHQIKLTTFFGLIDNKSSLAIEQFMKIYFKKIKRIREMNEILMQWLAEVIIPPKIKQFVLLDNHFQLINNFIEVRDKDLFSINPYALLELFVWIARRPSIQGVRASTIRLIQQHLYLINKQFKTSTRATNLFLTLFKDNNNPYNALHYMNKYGVLSHYLDCYALVVGQMQYDLFHSYTVDQHTLFVIRNLTRFLSIDYAKQFSLANKLMHKIEKRDILYLAALFHDIAKGRGGNHSELGAKEAFQFAIRHQLTELEQNLLVWLVQNHLLMSQTAQRQDIYDPQVIQNFCHLLPKPYYLDYLYLLTVADICATNQNLWNSWKDSLLKELYHATALACQTEEKQISKTTLISSRKQQAMVLLQAEGIPFHVINSIWDNFKGRYFLHESPEMIACHTQAILTCKEYPLVLILPHYNQGGTEIFIYMPHREERFTIATTVLNNLHLTIQEATILTCDNDFDLDTYIILDEKHQALSENQQIKLIQQFLSKQLSDYTTTLNPVKRRLSRTQAHFYVKPHISFDEDMHHTYTRLFLITNDRPGLLACISQVFSKLAIHLHHAKVVTAGERAEDSFYLTNRLSMPLTPEEKMRLKEQLLIELV